jgi:iron complex outermembrane receptor protein
VSTGIATLIALATTSGTALKDEIVVSVAPGDRPASEVIEPVIVISGEELVRLRAGTLGDLLGTQPGVANASFGPGVGRPVIRGQEGPRVQVLENGVRAMDISTVAADHAIAIDPLVARKVEVIKGPATLLYGSAASGGVVNVINNRINPDFTAGLTGQGGFSWADNGRERLGHLDLTQGWENVALQLDVSGRRSADFDIPGFADVDGGGRRGVLENSSIDNWGGALSGVWRGERGYLGVSVSRLEYDYGLPEEIDPEDPEFERIELEQTRLDLRGELRDPLPGFTLARLAFGLNRYEQQELEFEDGEREIEVAFDNREFDLRADLTHQPVAGWTGVLGLQVTQREFDALAEPGSGDPEDYFVPPSDTDSWALFAIEELPVSWGRIQLGGRVERVRVGPEDSSSLRFTPVSLAAGALIDLGERHRLMLNANRAERAPAAEELLSDGRHAATRSYEIGDASLGRERSNEADIGFLRHRGAWTWQVNGFYKRIDGFIYREFQVDADGEILLVNDDGVAAGNQRNRLVNYRQRDADFYGLEAQTAWRLLDGPSLRVDGRVFADLVRGQLRDADEDLPRITPVRLGLGLDAAWADWSAGVDFVRTRTQRDIGVGETPTDAYSMLGLDVAWRTRWSGLETEFYLRGRNLLDEEARLHTSFLKDEAPLPGRTWLAGVRMAF